MEVKTVSSMLDELLRRAVEKRASDIHIAVGAPPVFRINGSLLAAGDIPLTDQDTAGILEAMISQEQCVQFHEQGEFDFSYAIAGAGRFRVNAFRQCGFTALAIRIVNEKVPTLTELGHPEAVQTFARNARGLILVTGPTGSGKSTTLAAMIDLINRERSVHIITLEDPVEYLHKHNKSIVAQREIHLDSKSFASALRAALREDPDVILVGEMRDVETIDTAVTAAETGHLVLATLHTGDTAQTIDRIIGAFSPHQQQQIRAQLALTLQGIVAQQLLPRLDGSGRVAAFEILNVTPAVRNLIREGKTHQIPSVIQTGARFGMVSMDMSLCDLYRRGLISYEMALASAADPESFLRLANR